MSLSDDASSAFMRSVLGLDDESDRKLLADKDVVHRPELLIEENKEDAEEGLSPEPPEVKIKRMPREEEQQQQLAEGGDGAVGDDGQHGEAPLRPEDHPTQLWPDMLSILRERVATDEASVGGGGSVADGSADEAGLIGMFLKALKEVHGSLEGERTILQSIESSKRLPAFARKDLVIVKRRELDAVRQAGLEAVESLTASMDDGAVELLRLRAGREACCDAVDGLSIAWRCCKSVIKLRTGGGSAAAAGRRGGGDPLVKQKRRGLGNKGGGRGGGKGGGVGGSSLTEEEADQLAEADTALDDSRMLVDSAAAGVTAELRRRRTNVAVASSAHVRGGGGGEEQSQQSTGSSSPDRWGMRRPRAGRTDTGTARFDNYARGTVPEVGGTLAMSQRGKLAARQRKAEERGSVFVSRHVDHLPSFSDVMGLSVGATKAALHDGEEKFDRPLDLPNGGRSQEELDRDHFMLDYDGKPGDGEGRDTASLLLERADWRPSPRFEEGVYSEGKENVDTDRDDAERARRMRQLELRNANNARQVQGGHAQYMESRTKALKEKVHGLSPTKMLPAQRRMLEKQLREQEQAAEEAEGGAAGGGLSPRVIIPEGWDTNPGSKPNSKGGAPLSSAIDLGSFDKW